MRPAWRSRTRQDGSRLIRSTRPAVVALLTALLTAATTSAAWAASPAPAKALGYDVSYPQCGKPLPTGGSFGIVGVTGGLAFSKNPCLATQYRWATRMPNSAAVYVNTGNPAPASNHYWPASGSHDPALCKDNRSTTDPGCAYDYGWHAAADAVATATSVAPATLRLTWWLDVETAPNWHGDGPSNAADLQGALDYLRGHGVPTVGLYSTGYRWQAITGGYTASSAGRYKAAWAPEFAPQQPMESVPLWIATGGDAAAASAACPTTFTGAPAWLAQYRDGGGRDANLVCG
ncbi:hypothetical protein [Pseudonocardia acidicola]|uniref:GH25 family lysozyme M1 (1,4-beta-N-acetylmuramidase) n=1 Tax=Pseudonocardia acidicola TaxID=2724939 RepID=A0ABX1SGV7_9PSEU|nr:hypothetical protein [Pseudonocardia acidicola]NMI00098.1 hypothetical protein [Pseudonocardia acidicola]